MQFAAHRLDAPLAAGVSRRKDEIGALSHSLEAMTGALADRIDANERFAADVSHEIKNPLASIQSAVASARAARDAGAASQMLAIVAQDVQRLDRLITDIARASRIEAETARGRSQARSISARCCSNSRALTRTPPDETSARLARRVQGRQARALRGDRPELVRSAKCSAI